MKKLLLAASAAMTFGAAPAFAADCDPCVAPLPNEQWHYDLSGTDTDTVTDVTHDIFNQAALKSGGKASDKNKSNFDNVTTTVTEITTNYYDAINPGGQHVDNKDSFETFSEVLSSSTVKVKVH